MKRLIIVGSPRSNGRSAHLAEMLFEACIDECPEDELYLAPVSELDIAGCIACDACKRAGERAAQARLADAGIVGACDEESAKRGAEADAEAETDDELPIAYCPRFDDDMLELYDVLADADELVVVSPVFFSGAPAGLTALLDRLQPYFWEWIALRAAGEAGAALAARKRPATLHVIGEGLDKNGYIALVSKVRSALAPAGFVLERVMDWVGKIEPDGTIVEEAVEYRLPSLGVPLAASDAYLLPADGIGWATGPGAVAQLGREARVDDRVEDRDDGGHVDNSAAGALSERPAAQRAARPKLDLSGNGRQSSSSKGSKGSKSGSGSKGSKSGSGGKGGHSGGTRKRKGGKRHG